MIINSENQRAFCIHCGVKKRPYTISSNIVEGHTRYKTHGPDDSFTYNYVYYEYEEITAYCMDCGEEVYVPQIEDRYIEAFNEAAAKAIKAAMNDIRKETSECV